MRDNDTPTWNAIELSSPVAFAVRLEMGELNSWHSDPPPSCVTKACKTAFVTGGGKVVRLPPGGGGVQLQNGLVTMPPSARRAAPLVALEALEQT
jgi:hypothetical protein